MSDRDLFDEIARYEARPEKRTRAPASPRKTVTKTGTNTTAAKPKKR